MNNYAQNWVRLGSLLRVCRRGNQNAMSKLSFRPEGYEGSVEQYLPIFYQWTE